MEEMNHSKPYANSTSSQTNMKTTENMALWNAVEKTNPAYTKKAKISGMSITAVAPQYQVMNATKQFGPYAIKWGFKDIEFDFSLVESLKIIVFKGTFFCPDGECVIGNSCKAFMDRDCKMVDADFAKKLETDALTKVLSKMGFNADIFMGRYDDTKYVTEMKQEFAPKPPTQKEAIEKLETAKTVDMLVKVWNSLPIDLKQNESVIESKNKQKSTLTPTK